jgi:2-keto-myo-inositol isomerase
MRCGLREDWKVAEEADFQAIEIWARKLRKLVREEGVEALRGLAGEMSPSPISISSIERINSPNRKERERAKRQCAELSELASKIGCESIVAVPGPRETGQEEETILKHTAESLHDLAEIASPHGVRIGFEFLGFSDCSVRDLRSAHIILEELGRKDVGLIVDSFHFFVGGSKPEDLESTDPEKIFIFHINDCENLPREELKDEHRLFPGCGAMPLREIMGALRRSGYDGPVSVELFRPEYWKMNPREVAERARETTLKILKEAGFC